MLTRCRTSVVHPTRSNFVPEPVFFPSALAGAFGAAQVLVGIRSLDFLPLSAVSLVFLCSGPHPHRTALRPPDGIRDRSTQNPCRSLAPTLAQAVKPLQLEFVVLLVPD